MKIKDFVITPNGVTGIILDKIGQRRQMHYVMDTNGETYEYYEDSLKEKNPDNIPAEVKEKLLSTAQIYDNCKEANKEYIRAQAQLQDLQKQYKDSIIELSKLNPTISADDFCEIFKKNLRTVVKDKLDKFGYEITVASKKQDNYFTINYERRVVVKYLEVRGNFTKDDVIAHYSKNNVDLFTNVNYPSRVHSDNFIDVCGGIGNPQTLFCHSTTWQFPKKFMTDNFAELFAKSLRLTPLDD